MINRKICPVCGFRELEEAPYDKFGYPSYVICPCCGFEFGFDDSSRRKTFEDYREEWILDGFKFNDEELKPKDWNEGALKKQLKNLSMVDYKPRL